MKILPLRQDLVDELKKAGLIGKYKKQKRFFEHNFRHPSLNTEKLHPKKFNLYSFRIDGKWRAIFVFKDKETVEVVDVNPHYND